MSRRKRYGMVATGGTFDILHRGHYALLDKAFSVSDAVLIGLTSDGMLAARAVKVPVHTYGVRLANLVLYVGRAYPGSVCAIRQLDDDFGPAILDRAVEALVASAETAHTITKLNRVRVSAGLEPVDLVMVPMVSAYDGRRISTTRIRNGEIDGRGNRI